MLLLNTLEVFDMIVGTSTGSLISFALVGGNTEKDGDVDKRLPMTIKEVIEMYKKDTPIIFQQNCAKRLVNNVSNSLLGTTILKYGNDGIVSCLEDQFGDATLASFEDQHCVAGMCNKNYFDNNSHVSQKFLNDISFRSCG